MSAFFSAIEGNPISLTEMTSETRDAYSSRIERFSVNHRAISRRWSMIANLRLAAFVVIGLTLWWLWDQRDIWILAPLLLEIGAVIWLIALHTRLRHERDALKRLIDVNHRAIARLDLRWNDLPAPPDQEIPRDHPFAWDLNIVGDASLLRRIGTPVTDGGWRTLTSRLTSTDRVDDVPQRQTAIQELAPEIDIRQRVEANALRDEGTLKSPEALLAWAEGSGQLQSSPRLRWFAHLSPIVTVGLMLAQATGLLSYPLWLMPLVIQILVSQTIATDASRQVRQIAPLQREIAGYVDIFSEIERSNPKAPLLTDLHQTLSHDDAAASIGRLSRVCSLAIPAGTLLYTPMQMLFLWDVNVLSVMERWQSNSGHRIRAWLDAVAQWEALSALSVLAHDHPSWSFPDVDPAHETLTAQRLRHPLIPESDAIGNDIEVGPPGKIVFVTGSNMSGKSTLLRAVGINAVLARSGAPVAADRCRMPSLDIRSCMRVEDSIDRGVSFFMAELLRLKAVVDAAKSATDQPVLYLLDEILQGTNTAERQIASRQVMKSLASSHAIGAVSSHDLELFDAAALEELAIPVHFAEQFDRSTTPPQMHFDYHLRPGIATSTNALALMEMLGFDIEP
jgi:hypothetical protein